MSATSLLLNVRWVRPGRATDPTVLAFTGFGHRLDPWIRLQPEGWRVGVLEFPIGSPPGRVWQPEALAAQLGRYWGQASRRALMGFSFGAAGATRVAGVLAKADAGARPEYVAYVAPVQWANIPWQLLRRVPRGLRLNALRGLARGTGSLLPLVSHGRGQTVKHFVNIVDKHVGWDFVAHYLPYLDWIDSPKRTLETWSSHPWPSLLVGASQDTVIPAAGMRSAMPAYPKLMYREVSASHFDALDQAGPHLRRALAQLVGGQVPVA